MFRSLLLLLVVFFLTPVSVHAGQGGARRDKRIALGDATKDRAEKAAAAKITEAQSADGALAKKLQQPNLSEAESSHIQQEQNKLKEAVDQAQSTHPESPLVNNSASNFYQAQGNLKRSGQLAEQGLAHASPDGDKKLTSNLLANLATSRYAEGRFEEALQKAKIAYELDPTNMRAFEIYQYSDSALRAGQIAPLTEHTERLIALTNQALPHDRNEWAKQQEESSTESGRLTVDAVKYSKKGDVKTALTFAEAAVKADSSDAMAYFIRGNLYRDSGKFDLALADYSVAASKGWKENIFSLRADVVLRPSRDLSSKADRALLYRGAISDASMAIAQNPKDANAYYLRAIAKGLLKRPVLEVLADYQAAAEHDRKYKAQFEELKSLVAAQSSHETKSEAPAVIGQASEKRSPIAPIQAPAAKPSWIFWGLALLIAAWSLIKRGKTASPPGLLGGNFRLVHELGEGGMGVVYKGMDENLKRGVAIKRMRDNLRNDPAGREKFLAEARTVASLKHPNIVVLHQAVTEADELWLIFEEVQGKTLHSLIQESPHKRFDFSSTARILKMACAAVDYAHSRNVLHRDLKPSNIMIENETVKVMDFGLARSFRTGEGVQTASQTGTPPYMAPEQAMGEVSKESDIYSLAVCAYEMLTGELPFQGESALANKIEGRFPALESRGVKGAASLEEVFKKALDPDRRNRFHSGTEFLEAFTRSLLPPPRPV